MAFFPIALNLPPVSSACGKFAAGVKYRWQICCRCQLPLANLSPVSTRMLVLGKHWSLSFFPQTLKNLIHFLVLLNLTDFWPILSKQHFPCCPSYLFHTMKRNTILANPTKISILLIMKIRQTTIKNVPQLYLFWTKHRKSTKSL